MKKNIFKSLLLTAVVSTVGIGSVYAATPEPEYEVQPTNASDYSIKFAHVNKGILSDTRLEVRGLSPKNISNFYVKMVDKDTKSEEVSYSSMSAEGDSDRLKKPISLQKSTEGYLFKNIGMDSFFTTNRELYAYIYNCPSGVSVCKPTTTTPIKVERDPMPELSQRYQVNVFPINSTTAGEYAGHITIFHLYPIDSSYPITNTATLKVGIIEDSSVIKSLANNEAGAMQQLYDYAKNATNGISYSAPLNDFKDIDCSNLTVQNGSFYYLYLSVEDSKNEYIDLSDVFIVKAINNNLATDFTYDKADVVDVENYDYGCYACTNDYVWTVKGYQASTCQLVDNITSKGNCVKSVKTGVEDYLVPGAIVMVVGGAIVALVSKKSKFRRI